MKKINHPQVLHHIQQALSLLGYSDRYAETKLYLTKAVEAARKMATKDARKLTAMEEWAERAKKKNEEWMKMITESAVKMSMGDLPVPKDLPKM